MIICEQCGDPFEPAPKARGRQRFCRTPCRQKWHQVNNPRGQYLNHYRRTVYYPKARERILRYKKTVPRCECGRVKPKGAVECPRCAGILASQYLPAKSQQNAEARTAREHEVRGGPH